jgi:hypothetical protein
MEATGKKGRAEKLLESRLQGGYERPDQRCNGTWAEAASSPRELWIRLHVYIITSFSQLKCHVRDSASDLDERAQHMVSLTVSMTSFAVCSPLHLRRRRFYPFTCGVLFLRMNYYYRPFQTAAPLSRGVYRHNLDSKMAVIWVVAPCSLVKAYGRSGPWEWRQQAPMKCR